MTFGLRLLLTCSSLAACATLPACTSLGVDSTTEAFLYRFFYAGLATLTLLLVLLALKWLSTRLLAKLDAWQGTWIRTWRIQSLVIIDQQRIHHLLALAFKTLRTVLTLIVLYLYLSVVFSFFPATRDYGDRLLGYIQAPLLGLWYGIIAYIPNLFFIGVTVVATHYFLRFIRLFFNELGKGTISLPNFHPEWADPTFHIVRFLVLAFAVVVAFPYLPGAESPAFKGVSVFLGILISFGSTSAVGNLVAGVIITYMRPFNVGDRVKIAETVGDVVEKTLLVTRIRTIKNVDITIPNALMLNNHLTNYSAVAREQGLILHTTVTIGYDVPWRQVHQLLLAAAKTTEHILAQPGPFVLQTSLDDFYVSYELNAYTDKASAMATIYSELHQNIQDRFNEAGVEIMSPHFSQLRDGNATAIPADYLPAGYVPGGFRLQPTEKTPPQS